MDDVVREKVFQYSSEGETWFEMWVFLTWNIGLGCSPSSNVLNGKSLFVFGCVVVGGCGSLPSSIVGLLLDCLYRSPSLYGGCWNHLLKQRGGVGWVERIGLASQHSLVVCKNWRCWLHWHWVFSAGAFASEVTQEAILSCNLVDQCWWMSCFAYFSIFLTSLSSMQLDSKSYFITTKVVVPYQISALSAAVLGATLIWLFPLSYFGCFRVH